MKRQGLINLVVILLTLGAPYAGAETVIQGAGATFPYPCYSQWAYKFYELSRIKVTYQSIGSGAGMAQIKAKNVDFAGSDVPLQPDYLRKANLVQFPTLVGGIVPIVNLKGVGAGDLRLSPEVLAQIFLKKITHWRDPAFKKENPNLSLPDKEITVVHREDGSGTTFIFTNYLSQISPVWKEQVGSDKEVDWPTGLGAKGNEGVASTVMQIEGSVGYVEYAYALQNRIPYALVQNHDGNYIHPNTETFRAAADNADWKQAPDFYMILTNQPGKFSWPIVGATFILVHRSQTDLHRAASMFKFFHWSYRSGQDIARNLHYVPLPDNVVQMIEETWSREVKAADGSKIWTPKASLRSEAMKKIIID